MCAALELGVLSGVPMRPEEIRSLMKQINQPTLAHVLPTEDQRGDDPPTNVRRRPHQGAAPAKSCPLNDDHFRPVIDIKSGGSEPSGLLALVRWFRCHARTSVAVRD